MKLCTAEPSSSFVFCLICFLRYLVWFAFSGYSRLSITSIIKSTLVKQRRCLKNVLMEGKALALMVKIKKENLDPRKWIRPETLNGFSDFIQDKQLNKDADDGYDNKEMCEYE